MQLHYFNPGYEAALLLEKPNYTAPANVQRMQRELAFLPLWYGEPEDYVWVEGGETDLSFLTLPDDFPSLPTLLTPALWANNSFALPPLKASPWGLSPQSIRFFEALRAVEGRALDVPEWADYYLPLIGRQTAANCLEQLRRQTTYPLPQTPVFLSSVEEVEAFLLRHPSPFVLKMPYSSSGRGLLRVEGPLPAKEKEWLTGALRKQGTISLEPRLQKEKDFALEFYISPEGKAEYKGLSVFVTEGWKTYCGNLLQSQAALEKLIFTADLPLSSLQALLIPLLEELFGGKYTGYLGVDMMRYTSEGKSLIHPCVEINMRYTMGLVAVRLFERIIHPEARGQFRVLYAPDAWQHHRQMSEDYPAEYKNGRLRKGYLPLCPVHAETHYRAFVFVE